MTLAESWQMLECETRDTFRVATNIYVSTRCFSYDVTDLSLRTFNDATKYW